MQPLKAALPLDDTIYSRIEASGSYLRLYWPWWWEPPKTCCWCNDCLLESAPGPQPHQTAVSEPSGPTHTPSHRLQSAHPPLGCRADPGPRWPGTGATHGERTKSKKEVFNLLSILAGRKTGEWQKVTKSNSLGAAPPEVVGRKTKIHLHPQLFYRDPNWAKMAFERRASSLAHYSNMLAAVKVNEMGHTHPGS